VCVDMWDRQCYVSKSHNRNHFKLVQGGGSSVLIVGQCSIYNFSLFVDNIEP
jgi:hypothetical protein